MGPQGPPGPVQRVDGGVSMPAEPAEKVSIKLTEALPDYVILVEYDQWVLRDRPDHQDLYRQWTEESQYL